MTKQSFVLHCGFSTVYVDDFAWDKANDLHLKYCVPFILYSDSSWTFDLILFYRNKSLLKLLKRMK